MDRTRESRRSSMASSNNGFPRRRQRTIALRGSSEEGAVELREAPSKRGRNRDSDRDSASRSRRRRGSYSHRDDGEQSTEGSIGNDRDDDVQDAGVSRIRSPNTTSSVPDQNHRRRFTPAISPPFKITDEMIGVTVPRKARSASVKRPHESSVSASGGGDERNFRQRSKSPGRQSVEPASPSSSNVSVGKKMKAIGADPKTTKSSSSDIEIEIAELLYGLMTSKNNEPSSQKVEASINHHISVSSPSKDAEKKKVENYYSSALVPNNSRDELVRIKNEQPADVDCRDGNASSHENRTSEAPKEEIVEDKMISAEGRSRELPSCSKLDADNHDSASTRVISAVLEGNTQRVGKFEIDLMAPPPIMLSPEGDDLSRDDFTSETKAFVLDVEMNKEDRIKAERSVQEEKTLEEIEEGKMVTIKEKLDVLKYDLEKPYSDNDIRTNCKLKEQDRNKELPILSSNPKVEKTAQSGSLPLSTAVSGQPSSLSPIGYMQPLQTVVKADKTTGSSTTPLHVNFVLSQPPPKRCATHHYIACNILRQQFTKMNPLPPAAVGLGSLCSTKPNNVNCVTSAENMVVRKKSQKQLPGVNQNDAQEKGWAATRDPSLSGIKSSNSASSTDSTHRMQLVLQQGPRPQSSGNLVHGPAFGFPPGQHQASAAVATYQAGVISPSSTSSHSTSLSSVAVSLGTSSTFPPVAPAMSFSHPSFSGSGSPYMTIIHNNGYSLSFPFSTSVGATAASKGATPAQSTHILSEPFYHPLQHPQQHPQSQALVQSSYGNASSSSSSSSHKKSQNAQVNGSNILTSTAMEQQSLKQQTSLSHLCKHETKIGEENAPQVANQTSYPQKNVQGQNLTIPVQPISLSFKPSATSDKVGGNSGNFGDKQQKQQALKGGVEIIPSQAFAISFAAFNGTSVPSNLSFSSMAQNPMIFHSLSDTAYQAASAPNTTQRKTHSVAEAYPSHQDDEKKKTNGKSSTNGPTTLVFDNSSKNLDFMLSPTNGNWPSRAIASTTITSVPLSSNASSSQKPPHMLQLQKQQDMQQQQPAIATRQKSLFTDTLSATKFANNGPVSSQTHAQCKSSSQACQPKTSGRTTDSRVQHTSIINITSNTPTLKSFSQEQGRVSQGHMQISFGENYITSQPPQGQQLFNHPLCTTSAGTPFNEGNLKPCSEGRKVSLLVNTSQLQQTENSSAGSGQKSSPVCGRNVPSILSSCTSHLSELKY